MYNTLYDTIASLQDAGFDMKQCAIATVPHTTDTDKRTTTITLAHVDIPVKFVVTIFTYLPRGVELTTVNDLRETVAGMFCDYVSIQAFTKRGRVIDSLSADYSDEVGRYGSAAFDAVVEAFREVVDYTATVYRLSH